jgi:hypothetical protein
MSQRKWRNNIVRYSLLAVVLVLICCSTGFALVPCGTNSLAFYVANYTSTTNGCQIDDKVFYGFVDTLTAGGGGSTGGVAIQVDPISTLYNPGLGFTLTGFAVGANSSLDLKLGFDVATISSAHTIEDASLGIAGAGINGTGLVSIGENVCAGGTFSNPGAGTGCPGGDQNISLNVSNPGAPPTFFDMKFTQSTAACPGGPPGLCNLVGVFKDVQVNGGTGTASLSSFTQQFSEVPEPGSIMLLGTSFILASLAFRRKQVKKS